MIESKVILNQENIQDVKYQDIIYFKKIGMNTSAVWNRYQLIFLKQCPK